MRAVTALILSSFVSLVTAQEPTLAEMAASTQKAVLKAIGTEEPVRALASLSASAHVIVQGTVRSVRTYLSTDGKLIYTDFELTATNFVAGSQRPRGTPGPTPAITIKQVGGKLQLAGVDVTVVDERLSLLPTGEPLLLFLEEIENGAKYQLVGMHWSAFEVKSGKIVPLVKPPESHGDYSGMALADFVRDVNRLRAARP